jgi:hypothetical protein
VASIGCNHLNHIQNQNACAPTDVIVGHMIWYIRPRTHPDYPHKQIQIVLKLLHSKNYYGGTLVVQTLQRLCMWVEVTGSNLMDSNKILYKQPITWCHMEAHDWATWHRTTNQNLPRVAISFIHIYQLSATQPYHVSYGLPHHHPYRLYGLYS